MWCKRLFEQHTTLLQACRRARRGSRRGCYGEKRGESRQGYRHHERGIAPEGETRRVEERRITANWGRALASSVTGAGDSGHIRDSPRKNKRSHGHRNRSIGASKERPQCPNLISSPRISRRKRPSLPKRDCVCLGGQVPQRPPRRAAKLSLIFVTPVFSSPILSGVQNP